MSIWRWTDFAGKARKMAKGEHGATMIVFVFSLVAIAASMALVTDIGLLAIEKARLNNAVDAATLAAARARIERPGIERVVGLEMYRDPGSFICDASDMAQC